MLLVHRDYYHEQPNGSLLLLELSDGLATIGFTHAE